MNKFMMALIVSVFASGAALAGGPIVIADEAKPIVVATPPSQVSPWVALVPVVICLAVCGGGSTTTTTTTPTP